MKDISVVIVDDNRELCNYLQQIINLTEGFTCPLTVGSADDAIWFIPRIKPDVVLMDINLKTLETGIDCVRVLKPHLSQTNFMICTVYEDDEKIFEALKAGATGYILKKTDPARLLIAIRDLYEGGSPISSQIAKKLVQSFQGLKKTNDDLDTLSVREIEVLGMLSDGLMYKEIAAKLFLSTETVRKHIYRVYKKLHVNNRVSAVNKYFDR